MKIKLYSVLFVSLINFSALATDSTFIYGSWKLQSYHIYSKGKGGMDTTYVTTGHVEFKVNHTYATERLQMCFMEGNNYSCPPNTTGTWVFISKDVLQLTYSDRKLICDGACPDPIARHGVYVLTLNRETMVLRTEYFNGSRKHRLVVDAYLVRKIE
jgi:hypothetical protein